MPEEHRFEAHYQSGDAPWDIGRPDSNLIQTVTTMPIKPRRALDIGCGTGDNAIWLALQDFQVVGIDSSETAIRKAEDKASKADVKCRFMVLDFLRSRIEGGPFDFAFDRGCFHVFDSAEERRRFAENVSEHLAENGLWLSLIGNADDERQGEGPPRRSAREIVNAVEPDFEILSLVSSHFETKLQYSPRAWVCLMRKRR